MPVDVTAIGHVDPYSTVSVRAQVSGTVTKVFFKEGQDVREGEPLFSVDSRPYQAALAQAQAALARDRAQAANARADAARYVDLVKKDYVTQEQYDQTQATSAALAATVKADEAAVENAKLNLGYCDVTAPVSGRTGSVLVYAGNVVAPNGNPLVVINQIQPILVSFSVPEAQLAEIKKEKELHKLKVTAAPADGSGSTHEGYLTFIDNAVDPATGTILLKGTFPNQHHGLWPGQFVNVTLALSAQENALVIPSAAVQTGQHGAYVFVIKDDMTVDLQPVKVERTEGNFSIITGGLNPRQRVVTDGQLRLAPGFKVEIKSSSEATT